MYKNHTVEEFKKYFDLPINYTVQGVFCYGSWRKNEHKKLLKQIIKEQGFKVEYEQLGQSFLREVLAFKINGRRYWFDTGYGGAYISEIFHLGSMLGSKKNIVLGSCGGLLASGKTGDIIIPSFSHGNESTTRMYHPDSKNSKHFSNKQLNESLKARLGALTNVHSGPVVTCQAMLFESWKDIKKWSDLGYFGVEMETSTVFAVSNYFQIPSASMLVISDNLIKKETVLHGNFKRASEKRNKKRDLIYKIALDELMSD